MSSRKLILLSLALLAGLGTFLAFRSATAPVPVTEAPAAVTEILAAARDLPTGSILRDADMKWIPWASTAENSRLFVKGTTDKSVLIGAVLREGLRANEPILAGRVVQPHEQGFLAAVLTPGMRAVSMNLTPSAEVAGFIFPGDHVDVILTHTFSRKDVSSLTERYVSETVITDVRVLALDQKSDNQSTDPKVALLATLEVTPKQAEKLALAASLIGNQASGGRGTLSLALRSLATDTGVSGESSAKTEAKTGPTWDSDISPAYPSVNGEDGLMQRVQIMRGKDVTEALFARHHMDATP